MLRLSFGNPHARAKNLQEGGSIAFDIAILPFLCDVLKGFGGSGRAASDPTGLKKNCPQRTFFFP